MSVLMFDEYYKLLENEAMCAGYRINPLSSVNRACHHPHYIIFIKKPLSIENIYSFAHEVGHCIDFKRGKLDMNKYRKDKKYRLLKEFIAWWFGFNLCLKLKIPIRINFIKHSIRCLYSYIKYN